MMASLVSETSISFNETGKFLSFCGKDGKLKVWDTSTGTLTREYTKNLHLSSPCSCLIWLQTSKTKSAKKRKSEKVRALSDEHDVIAIGTTAGSVMLYSVDNNSIISEGSGHSSKVNCLSWSKSTLYSCSDDKHIIEWDLSSHKVKNKWKAGKERLKSILALSCGKKLLSASCTIKLWDLELKEVLKTFVGHSTDVFSLLEVPGRSSYFISAATGDRALSAWSLSGSQENEGALASFLLQDSAMFAQLAGWSDITTLCAVTESGVLQVFEHKLNGTLSKPLKPKLNVTLVSEGENRKNLPIHAVHALETGNILIAYGNPAFLMFETLVLSELQDEFVVLVRQAKRRLAPDEFNSRTRIPETGGEVQYIASGAGPLSSGLKSSQRDVALEQRLENLAVATPSLDAPKKDNMAELLVQGLQSKDKNLIQDVLFRVEESVINSTVRHLPIQALHPLLRELTSLMQGKTFTSKMAVGWLNAVLRTHVAILLSNPELSTLLQPLLSTIDAKVEGLSALLRLRGRLGLVVEQITESNQADNEEFSEPLIIYQDRVDDSSEAETQMSSDSEDWDGFSDMDQDDVERENDDE